MRRPAPNITRVNLELGGKAPAIVLQGRRPRSRGQGDHRVAHHQHRPGVQLRRAHLRRAHGGGGILERFVAMMGAVRYGDPLADAGLDMGPLVSKAGSTRSSGMVGARARRGRNAVLGGGPADLGRGHHFLPTVLANCRPEMEIMRKEIFGPVAPIAVVDSLEEAVHQANDTEYGLTSSLYTRDLNAAMRVTRKLQFGETYINRENGEAIRASTPAERSRASAAPTASSVSTSIWKRRPSIWSTADRRSWRGRLRREVRADLWSTGTRRKPAPRSADPVSCLPHRRDFCGRRGTRQSASAVPRSGQRKGPLPPGD